jgi:hypothetical protein
MVNFLNYRCAILEVLKIFENWSDFCNFALTPKNQGGGVLKFTIHVCFILKICPDNICLSYPKDMSWQYMSVLSHRYVLTIYVCLIPKIYVCLIPKICPDKKCLSYPKDMSWQYISVSSQRYVCLILKILHAKLEKKGSGSYQKFENVELLTHYCMTILAPSSCGNI